MANLARLKLNVKIEQKQNIDQVLFLKDDLL